jgi:pyrroline-5-carboxylate reductase
VLKTNAEIVTTSDIIFLAVKPAYVKTVLQEIKPHFTENKVLVSMAAGVSISTLQSALNDSGLSAPDGNSVMPHIIRIMPNLPATVGEAMIAISPSTDVKNDETEAVKALLNSCGKAEVVPEKLMDGVTAVSGSGPAYAFLFIEALADAAVRFGMPRAQAYIYAAQTLRGAATMALEDERSISDLKDAVCSPAGTTIEGVIALEKHNFRGAVIDAATAAYNKSVELGRK